MPEEYLITSDGFLRLNEELHTLKEIERPQVVDAIVKARALGDLSENAEYHGAKQKQFYLEKKISELESISSIAKTVDIKTISKDFVQFGSKVRILDLTNDKESIIQLLNEYEADAKNGIISYKSPIGQGLLGAKVGSIVEIQKPDGTYEYEILEIL